MVVHRLAQDCGLCVPDARMISLGSRHRTFACCRFDRLPGGKRRFFVSSMTLLDRRDGEDASYLELAEFLSTRGTPDHKDEDLRELWTRVVFNILVSNRDDHLRNHGFILAADGWRLAPAFDVNPNIEKGRHHLAIDAGDSTPDVDLALSTAGFYGLSDGQARDILGRVKRAVSRWQTVAALNHLSRAEIELMAQAFSAAGGAG
jgi:serine/threonine-protein kinase HipA